MVIHSAEVKLVIKMALSSCSIPCMHRTRLSFTHPNSCSSPSSSSSSLFPRNNNNDNISNNNIKKNDDYYNGFQVRYDTRTRSKSTHLSRYEHDDDDNNNNNNYNNGNNNENSNNINNGNDKSSSSCARLVVGSLYSSFQLDQVQKQEEEWIQNRKRNPLRWMVRILTILILVMM